MGLIGTVRVVEEDTAGEVDTVGEEDTAGKEDAEGKVDAEGKEDTVGKIDTVGEVDAEGEKDAVGEEAGKLGESVITELSNEFLITIPRDLGESVSSRLDALGESGSPFDLDSYVGVPQVGVQGNVVTDGV